MEDRNKKNNTNINPNIKTITNAVDSVVDKHIVDKNIDINITRDVYHVPFLLIVVMITLWINHSFGFESGTIGCGIVVSIGLIIWVSVVIMDYFKRNK